MEDDSRAVIFGRDATTYETARPSYPDASIAHVEALVDAATAIEIGAGTGKATEAMARPGLRLICLEPSPQMADILVAKELPGVEVVVSTFEDWAGEPGSADMIYAAQAWHWVDRQGSFDKAFRLLRPGGVLALMWNIPLDRYQRHEEIYNRFAPQLLAELDERIKRRDSRDWSADMEAAGFVDTRRFTHEWSEELTSDRYRALYSTYSDHMMLDEPDRSRLLDALAESVESDGGTATVEYRTEVFSGRKPDTGQR
ncbi:MAG: class I SAM-dependent methyltransferase [Actinomycetota bacterium]